MDKPNGERMGWVGGGDAELSRDKGEGGGALKRELEKEGLSGLVLEEVEEGRQT